MAPRPKVSLLPKPVREELAAEIRDNAYGNYVAIAHWLEVKGYSIGKSALAEYGATLRAFDESGTGLPERERLLLQLGRLRLQEQGVLEQLLALDNDG